MEFDPAWLSGLGPLLGPREVESSEAARHKPLQLEMIGWLDFQDENTVCVVCERFSEPNPSGEARLRSTGVSIVKSAIVELRRLKG